jgi:16S rRNA (guanine966-N2)-methyltransferase
MRIIAGRWRGHRLQAPPGRDTRPTTDRVREAWMSALMPDLPEARVLDLFAGSGALGLEALSRGASHVTFVERSGAALRALRGNVERLAAADRCAIVRGDAIAYAGALPAGSFDIVLADPPYDEEHAATLLRIFMRTSFATQLWVEHRSKEALPDAPGLRTRRYGDTALSTLTAPPGDE